MNARFGSSSVNYPGTIVRNGNNPSQPNMLVCLDGVTGGNDGGNGTGCNGALDGSSCRYVYQKKCNGKNGWWFPCSSLSLVKNAPPYGSFPPNPPTAPLGEWLMAHGSYMNII